MYSEDFNQAVAAIAGLQPGDHLCCMYMTEKEHRAILAPFIRTGLERGDKVLYIVDVPTAEKLFASLEEEGLNTSAYLSSGQLFVAESRKTYIRQGHFDPDSMLELLSRKTDKALKQGFKTLRVTGEMSWVLRGLPGSERLMEYEVKLHKYFSESSAIGLFQYDMRSFSPEVLMDVLSTHPIAIVRNKCYDNMYYTPPEEFLGPNRAEAELKHRLINLEERQLMENERRKFEQALKQSEIRARRQLEFTNAIFDNSGALILVLDYQGHILRFNTTCQRLTGYKEKEVIGQTLWDLFIPEEDIQFTKEMFENLTCGQFPERRENDWLTRDGNRIRVAWSHTCLLDAEQEVELIVSTGLDITDLSRMDSARKREFNTLQEYCEGRSACTSGLSLGIEPLSKARPEIFSEIVASLENLMEQSMEQNIYKVNYRVSSQLRELAEKLGKVQAGPRDLVQAYIQGLQNKTKDHKHRKSRAYTEEGRLMLIELMGYLATYYYNFCPGEELYE
jgi:PAS domain S-box-containing protein